MKINSNTRYLNGSPLRLHIGDVVHIKTCKEMSLDGTMSVDVDNNCACAILCRNNETIMVKLTHKMNYLFGCLEISNPRMEVIGFRGNHLQNIHVRLLDNVPQIKPDTLYLPEEVLK